MCEEHSQLVLRLLYNFHVSLCICTYQMHNNYVMYIVGCFEYWFSYTEFKIVRTSSSVVVTTQG